MADLIAADLMPAGTTLHADPSDMDAEATALPSGNIVFADEIYTSLSADGNAAAGGSVNGWMFWCADTPDGRFTLAALREKLAAQR